MSADTGPARSIGELFTKWAFRLLIVAVAVVVISPRGSVKQIHYDFQDPQQRSLWQLKPLRRIQLHHRSNIKCLLFLRFFKLFDLRIVGWV